jgi:catechol 2,3-dioxygenase-like lactoylglutathione lyase family enzyme
VLVSRVQLALNVSDIDAAVEFYSKLFGIEPSKRMPSYANFAIAEPPLKLVLIEYPSARRPGVAGAFNHLGVEVETPEQVRSETVRLSEAGLNPALQEETTCCYAVQDKAWVDDPDGARWEIYTVLADTREETGLDGDRSCCCTDGVVVPVDAARRSQSDCS